MVDYEKIKTVKVTGVSEPGKHRVVTKSPSSLKLVLDVVSKLVSSVLSKSFASSWSGFEADDHPWKLY